MLLSIDDGLCQRFLRAGATPETLAAHVEHHLALLADVPVRERVLLLRSADLDRLEQRLASSEVFASFEPLYNRIDRLAGLTFERVDLGFSAPQLEELEHRAAREGKTVAEYTALLLQTLLPQFFRTLPALDAPLLIYVDRATGDPIDTAQLGLEA